MAEGIYLLPIIGVIGQDFKYSDALLHLNAAKDSQYIKLIIDSPGGYIGEGAKIKKALQDSGKVMFAVNSGQVASYAVSLFTIAPRQNRVYDPAKGVFLIHLPFVSPEDGVSGTASDLEMIAKELKREQSDIIADYAKATGSDKTVLEGFMTENTPLTPEQVESLGFATVRKVEQLKAVAYYKNDNNMTNEETTKRLGTIETLLSKVVAFFAPKNLMVQTTDGKEIDFGPAIETPEQIAVGVSATVDGVPAEGDLTLATGEVYKFAAGVLSEIVPAGQAEPDEAAAELEALKVENAALKSEMETAKNEFVQFRGKADDQLKKLTEELTKFKNEFSTGDPAGQGAPASEQAPAKRKAFKS